MAAFPILAALVVADPLVFTFTPSWVWLALLCNLFDWMSVICFLPDARLLYRPWLGFIIPWET